MPPRKHTFFRYRHGAKAPVFSHGRESPPVQSHRIFASMTKPPKQAAEKLCLQASLRPACSAGRPLNKISDASRAKNRRADAYSGSTLERGDSAKRSRFSLFPQPAKGKTAPRESS